MMGSMIVRVLPLLVAVLVYGQDKPVRLTFEVASVKGSQRTGAVPQQILFLNSDTRPARS